MSATLPSKRPVIVVHHLLYASTLLFLAIRRSANHGDKSVAFPRDTAPIMQASSHHQKWRLLANTTEVKHHLTSVVHKHATAPCITLTWFRLHTVQRPTRKVRLRQIRRSPAQHLILLLQQPIPATQIA
jgi:hypothetical protein